MEEVEVTAGCFVIVGAGKRLDDLNIASLKESLRRQGIGAAGREEEAAGAGGLIIGETVSGGEGVVLVSVASMMLLSAL